MGSATQTPVKMKARHSAKEDWGVEHCVLEGVSWDTYEALLSEVSDGHRFLTYDNGTLEIMAPSGRHEHGKVFISRLLDLYALEMGIPTVCFGSVTIKRKDILKGLEPDCCYYVKNEPQMIGKVDLDFGSDPVPDLVIEMEISRRVSDREQIYAALGVPELWLDDEKSLRVLHLKKGAYRPAAKSLSFPGLSVKRFEDFLRQAGTKREFEILRKFQSWVRSEKAK